MPDAAGCALLIPMTCTRFAKRHHPRRERVRSVSDDHMHVLPEQPGGPCGPDGGGALSIAHDT
jgi:hypothetical protein